MRHVRGRVLAAGAAGAGLNPRRNFDGRRAYMREYYARNIEKRRAAARAQKRRARTREWALYVIAEVLRELAL